MKKLLLLLLCVPLMTLAQYNGKWLQKEVILSDVTVIPGISSEQLSGNVSYDPRAVCEEIVYCLTLKGINASVQYLERGTKINNQSVGSQHAILFSYDYNYSGLYNLKLRVYDVSNHGKLIGDFHNNLNMFFHSKSTLAQKFIDKMSTGCTYDTTFSKSPSSIKSNTNTEWQGNGSGFFISKSGYIVTNNHVIDGASEIEVEFKYKNEVEGFNAKVIKVDKTNDLAIIKIDDSEFTNISDIPYNFKTRSVDVGTEIFALGYPLALSLMGKDIKFTDGKISSKTGLDGDITTYQIQVPIQPGNSGGPLFDFKGNLIGITSSGVNRKLDLTENVNYAIKSSYLLNLIDVLPETISLPSSTQLSSKPLTEQIKILSDFVVLIKVK
jgi:S1-C subfamily serine protease